VVGRLEDSDRLADAFRRRWLLPAIRPRRCAWPSRRGPGCSAAARAGLAAVAAAPSGPRWPRRTLGAPRSPSPICS